MNSKKIYLASPLGFTSEGETYRTRIRVQLMEVGFVVLDPWESGAQFEQETKDIFAVDSTLARQAALNKLALKIGRSNIAMIDQADHVLAVLDGTEPDSGTVSELGYAVGRGKRVYGLRTDVRESGDFPGMPINLQVLTFIITSGGCLFRRIQDMTRNQFNGENIG
ncbi:nucleoside 2-deoxyribosyltransferase [Pelotalea chapellei]|uniref:Nucleoside 2-deoxyribosyltransferase n=1 Tax=Pelotalea chapellei TaxID=44671 RepID=A0ABS5UCM8_9BACT|nr:nucleoside 2-deoxyribosyltransferase [Pelotalea chapellei]MBT1073404.1 nucleoside 2-deoxyribosyltransferase [Pelotalea chapellei]